MHRLLNGRKIVSSLLALCTVVFLVTLLTTGTVATPGGADTEQANVTVSTASFDSADGGYDASTTSSDIELDQELARITDEKGLYEARHRYDLPEQVGLLEVTVPDGASVIALDGFIQTDSERQYRWDGTTERPGIEYQLQGNRSIDQTGPIAGPGRLIFADVGDWGIVSQPQTAHRWGWSGGSERVGFNRDVSVDGPGAVGDVIAYLGAYDKYTHEAHDQEFQLIVPERAELREDPDDIFESLSDASDTLRVGERDDRVFMIATPTARIDWGVRGLQTGPADLWTRDIERLDDADNVWLHEYIHTRQGWSSTPELRWFTEGGAVYYAALLTLEQDRIDFEEFRERLAVGTDEQRFRGSILSDPATWRSNANYHVGALVSGELDRQIRVDAAREQSLQSVFRQLNARDGVVSDETFIELLEDAGGEDVADEGVRLTETTDRPPMWDAQTHRDVFGDPLDPARITYAFADTDVTVSGPYRNRTVDSTDPVVLVPGEQLRFDVDATNFGETTGEYEVDLRVNDDAVETRTGTLDPDETERLSFEHTVEEQGEFVLSVGDAERFVSVREPATPTVRSFSAAESNVAVGERIELSVGLENTETYPAEMELTVTQDGEPFQTETVRLDSREERTIDIEQTVEESGTYVFELAGSPADPVVVTVTAAANGDASTDDQTDGISDESADDSDEPDGVSDDDADGAVGDDPADDADDSGDGFGMFLALLSIAAIVGLARWKRY